MTEPERTAPSPAAKLRLGTRQAQETRAVVEKLAATVDGIADIRASAEGREGVSSFLQKRKPNWLLP